MSIHLMYALKPIISQTLLVVGYRMMDKTLAPAFMEFIVYGGEVSLHIAVSTLKEKYNGVKEWNYRFLTEIETISEV